jgi:hypothetical protein
MEWLRELQDFLEFHGTARDLERQSKKKAIVERALADGTIDGKAAEAFDKLSYEEIAQRAGIARALKMASSMSRPLSFCRSRSMAFTPTPCG